METKKKIERCSFIGCKNKINLIKFDCSCQKSFCIKHHNKHSHNCPVIINNSKTINDNNPLIVPTKFIKI